MPIEKLPTFEIFKTFEKDCQFFLKEKCIIWNLTSDYELKSIFHKTFPGRKILATSENKIYILWWVLTNIYNHATKTLIKLKNFAI